MNYSILLVLTALRGTEPLAYLRTDPTYINTQEKYSYKVKLLTRILLTMAADLLSAASRLPIR